VEILSLDFLTALLAIVVIDLVLAGDNAIVIALASRNLPPHLQRKAILWGTAGAIAIRSAMTLAVVWLLKIPGLLLAGGVLLAWIAYKLLLPEEEGGEHAEGKFSATPGIWGAIRTIVVADMVMGLDNVLAVAGAAQGSYLLVVLGLLISIPIVVWGSTLVLKWIERFPAIIYFGSGVLAWTSAKMIMSEPLLKDAFDRNLPAVLLTYLAVMGGALWFGFRRNHRRIESRISARLALMAIPAEAETDRRTATQGDPAMPKVLVPVDGSPNSEIAVRHVANEYLKNNTAEPMEVHLLNVQQPLSRHIAQFIGRGTRASFHADEAAKAMRSARSLIERFGVPYTAHTRVGDKAGSIVGEALRLGCDRIVMGTARKNSLTRMLEDSTTNKVLEQTTLPVEVISGTAVSTFERFGLPVGLAAAFSLLVAATID